MHLIRWSILTLVMSFPLAGLQECTGDPTPTPAPYQWYYTCGDPVCSGYTPQEGIPYCSSTQVAGSPCAQLGDKCDPKDECNAMLLCSDSDPTQQPGGCPISRREYKKNIHYLETADVTALHRQLLETRLATYHYKNQQDQDKTQLGFIIDDQAFSPAVRPNGQQVDLYGYTSMTVAAVQEQAKQLEALKQEVATLKSALEANEKRCQ